MNFTVDNFQICVQDNEGRHTLDAIVQHQILCFFTVDLRNREMLPNFSPFVFDKFPGKFARLTPSELIENYSVTKCNSTGLFLNLSSFN